MSIYITTNPTMYVQAHMIHVICMYDLFHVYVNNLPGPVHQAAIDTLNAWLEQASLTCFVEGEMLSTALATDNPYLRIEVCFMLDLKGMHLYFKYTCNFIFRI